MRLICAFLVCAQFLSAETVEVGQYAQRHLMRSEYGAVSHQKERKFGGPDTLVALARYPNKFDLKYVKSARMVGFDGQIILGVHPDQVDDEDMRLLGVTAKPVHTTPCKLPYAVPEGGYKLRINCSSDFPTLKLESARFALARKWVSECAECTGWVLVSDFSDFFFQRKPFEGLGLPKGDELIFQEEYFGKNSTDRRDLGGRGVDNKYWFTHGGAEQCYGAAEADRMGRTPTLCSGSMLGAREAMLKFLARYQTEFEDHVGLGEKCDPTRISDQATLNYLFYTNAFADLQPKTAKHGEGPVNTVGMICSPVQGHGTKEAPDHSATDLLSLDGEGYVLNKDGVRANAVHQDKTCWLNLVLKYVYPRYSLNVDAVLEQYDKATATPSVL